MFWRSLLIDCSEGAAYIAPSFRRIDWSPLKELFCSCEGASLLPWKGNKVYAVLQCVAVCCSVLQCVAGCCRVLQCVAMCLYSLGRGIKCMPCCSVFQCVAVCCRVLQCVAVSLLPWKGYKVHAEWRWCIGCLKLQVSFRKTASNYRALFRKMTQKDRGLYLFRGFYLRKCELCWCSIGLF